MQLNKFIAHAGICSRRKAAELVKEGVVTVNNKKITNPAYNVSPNDKVCVQGKLIKTQSFVYILLNKPKGYITTVSDEVGRQTVLDLIKLKNKVRIYPVGRLDRDTTGLLLLTNDGVLAQKLAHPRFGVEKVYRVFLDKGLSHEDMQKIIGGIRLKDGRVKIDKIKYIPGKYKRVLEVTLHTGKYRIIRRLFEHLGYNVKSLDRIRYAHLTKRGLKGGMWRNLTKKEVEELKTKK